MKRRTVLPIAILPGVTGILSGIFSRPNSGKPNPGNVTMPGNLPDYSGDNPTARAYNGTGMYGERLFLAQNVSFESEKDIEPCCYPDSFFLALDIQRMKWVSWSTGTGI
ncbi:MAG: hypothetical protein WC379_06980 [Methanoregula sp.]|jgi:lipopolysaccharide export system protein LptC